MAVVQAVARAVQPDCKESMILNTASIYLVQYVSNCVSDCMPLTVFLGKKSM